MAFLLLYWFAIIHTCSCAEPLSCLQSVLGSVVIPAFVCRCVRQKAPYCAGCVSVWLCARWRGALPIFCGTGGARTDTLVHNGEGAMGTIYPLQPTGQRNNKCIGNIAFNANCSAFLHSVWTSVVNVFYNKLLKMFL